MSRNQLIELLAEYFTGAAVGTNSIGLQISTHRVAAQQFFALRNAFGVGNLDGVGTAKKAIARRLRQGRIFDVNEHGTAKAR